MCGIAGFLGAGERSVLQQMTTALAHRGPDGEGYWIDKDTPVFLGHRRLSIVDIAAGSQPMTTVDDQLVITFNGEIYNHAELRAELENRGHRFKTDHSCTDTGNGGTASWRGSMGCGPSRFMTGAGANFFCHVIGLEKSRSSIIRMITRLPLPQN